MKIKSKIDYDQEIKLDLLEHNKLSKAINKNYINNKELFEEYKIYNAKKLEWEEKGLGIPPLTNKIGIAIIQIATRRCNSWYKTKNYSLSWKEEMIANAIMIATTRSHGFDPERFDNPFAYLTQICNNAIIEQLKRERTGLYVKYKMIEESDFQANFEENGETEESDMQSVDNIGEFAADERRSYIEKFEQSHFKDKPEKPSDIVSLFNEESEADSEQ